MINYEKLTEKRVDTIADGSFVSWLAVDGDRVVGTSGMSFVEED